MTGSTQSTDFPLVNAIYPTFEAGAAFVTKLSADGQTVLYSTYLGGNTNYQGGIGGDDFGYGIAVDSAGNATDGADQLHRFPHG